MTAFYDTSSLLEMGDALFTDDAPHFYISSVTLSELENIKTNQSKTDGLKYKARNLVRLLDGHQDKYTTVIADTAVHAIVEKHYLPISNDNLILACATLVNADVVYSEDLCMRQIGRSVFNLPMESAPTVIENPLSSGYKQVTLTDSEYAIFLNDLKSNDFGCYINEYLVIYDGEFDLRDVFRWDGNGFIPAYSKPLKSLTMGDKIKAKDEFQKCAIDSLINNQFTALTGSAGSGKSLLCLSAAMYLIDSHKYESLVILFNPTSARGAQKLGYYSGNATEKAKQTSIGHILNSKFGDPYVVDNLLTSGRLKLISMADCRGTEVANDSILYITECQNTSADLLKLCLTRVSSESKVFIEGDYDSQVDDTLFSGENNGLIKAIKAFSGNQVFAHIDLPNIYRSKIAEMAQLL